MQLVTRQTKKSAFYPRLIIRPYILKVNKLDCFVTKYCYFIEIERWKQYIYEQNHRFL